MVDTVLAFRLPPILMAVSEVVSTWDNIWQTGICFWGGGLFCGRHFEQRPLFDARGTVACRRGQ